MQGRCPVLTCRHCKTCVDGCPNCDGPLMAVPCDDAAIERVAAKLAEIQGYHAGPLDIDRRSAKALLRAAGETP